MNSSTFEEMRTANNTLEKNVAFMRESVLDVQNVRAITQATTKQAAQLAVVHQAVSVEKLISGLRKKGMKNEENEEGAAEDGDFDWTRLGLAVGMLFAAPPSVEFLCGPIGKPAAEKKERAKRKAGEDEAKDVAEARPESVITKDDDVVESTQKRLKVISEQMFGHQRRAAARFTASGAPRAAADSEASAAVDFFSMLVNPASFTQTVENIFDLSFLVKQGSASLALSEETGLPVVQALTSKGMGDGDAGDDQKSTQLVMSLCPADLRRVTEAFGCTGAGVAHRTDATYRKEYEGHLVGKKSAPRTSVGASLSASSSPSSAPAEMLPPKGKGRARR